MRPEQFQKAYDQWGFNIILGLIKSKLLIKDRTKFEHFQRKVGQNSDSQTRNHTPLQEHAHTSMLALCCSDKPNSTKQNKKKVYAHGGCILKIKGLQAGQLGCILKIKWLQASQRGVVDIDPAR